MNLKYENNTVQMLRRETKKKREHKNSNKKLQKSTNLEIFSSLLSNANKCTYIKRKRKRLESIAHNAGLEF